jgi:hypothetical protein
LQYTLKQHCQASLLRTLVKEDGILRKTGGTRWCIQHDLGLHLCEISYAGSLVEEFLPYLEVADFQVFVNEEVNSSKITDLANVLEGYDDVKKPVKNAK